MSKQPRIQMTTAASLLIHAVLFTLLAYTVKKQSPMLIPPAYKVNLVSVGKSSAAKTTDTAAKKVTEQQQTQKHTVTKPIVETKEPEVVKPVTKKEPPVKKEMQQPKKDVTKPEKEVKTLPKEAAQKKETQKTPPVKLETKPEEKITKTEPKEVEPRETEVSVEEKIAALKAKKDIQQHAMLRSMVSVKGEGNAKATAQRQGNTSTLIESPNGVDSNDILAQYIGLIGDHVRKRWVFPDSAKKNLEAIVFFTIRKDGKIENIKLDKTSGNTFYDRSCLSAVNKSVPLPVPPVDNMEVAIRFHP
ncbi:MAG: TonB family protein [Nitrospirae bacterium]|nr:TonB family protein [Nitrospirota bacterium]